MNVTTHPRKRVRNPASQEMILAAAERVVAARGAAHLTIDAVAREAGISKGGLLYNFPSKQALLRAMVGTAVNRYKTAAERARAQIGESANAGVRTRLSVSMNEVVDQRAGLAILAAAAEDPSLLESMRTLIGEIKADIEQTADDPVGAFIVWLAADALMLWDRLGIAPFDQQMRAAIEERLHTEAGSRPVERRAAASGR